MNQTSGMTFGPCSTVARHLEVGIAGCTERSDRQLRVRGENFVALRGAERRRAQGVDISLDAWI